jgi:ribosomal protein S18 acetylase RimI-like enzyme
MLKTSKMISRDVGACAAMVLKHSVFSPYGFSEKKFSAILKKTLRDHSSFLIVAKDGDQNPVGFLWSLKRGGFGRSGYLKFICVDPEFKGKGVGRQLVKTLEKQLKGTKHLFVMTTSTNKGAKKFYAGLGFKSVGIIRDYVLPGTHELLLVKRL